MPGKGRWLRGVCLVLLPLLCVGASLFIGLYDLSPGDVLAILFHPGQAEAAQVSVVWQLRLPRTLAAALVLAPVIVGVFSPAGTQVHALALEGFHFFAPTFLFAGVNIFASALFTALGWFDKLAQHAGAGTLVPITGFANAVASPALEFKSEGLVLGVGARMFAIAGPVLVYGISASVVYGVVLVFLGYG